MASTDDDEDRGGCFSGSGTALGVMKDERAATVSGTDLAAPAKTVGSGGWYMWEGSGGGDGDGREG